MSKDMRIIKFETMIRDLNKEIEKGLKIAMTNEEAREKH